MEIYNEQMERLEDVNLELGWLEEAERTVQHEATDAVEEIWHYEVTAEYPNGGKDVRRVIDVPGIPAEEAWTERIPIQIYHPYTQEELTQSEQETAGMTMAERMDRLEKTVKMISDTLETATQQWAEVLAQKGEE